ncbi:uncharacterized protein EAF02_003994 [Botrytis sinoallii]|uniref:uncharacterized protein n=1 Tax=Botrytis sinoallii TaxID=1463999 RepID=UPI0018FF55BC|nr:uncharacterized protein EAF02_003994 [Botrytis sinoallii]KAF7885485.1 hypothetical protein EAF02_003994 [Botrytis sinoallii]
MGLKTLHNRLNNIDTPNDPSKTITKGMYIRRAIELVEWNKFDAISLPPAYTEAQLFPEVQVLRSPPVIFEQKAPLTNTVEEAIAETPARTLISSNPASVHGIFSPTCEELSDSEVNLEDIEKDTRCFEMNLDVDSDEERLAILKSRELSQELNHSKASQILNLKLRKWVQTALRINPNVHKHKRLVTKFSILNNCIRSSNTGLFDATLPWCSAQFFFDPHDSDPENIRGLWRERKSKLILEITELIQWANDMYPGAEISRSVIDHFMKLSDIARTFALNPSDSKWGGFIDQKGVCLLEVWAKFDEPSGSISKESSRSVSRRSLGN